MDPRERVELALESSVMGASRDGCPPGLAAAVRHAIFPGGARVRPLLCLGVSVACGDGAPKAADAAAAAIELLHCASLVHDDLPCFDDADLRRGKPSVHRAFGEPIAVLTGDALIVLAFETMAMACRNAPRMLPDLVSILSKAVGMSGGLAAGQAWESEANVPLATYHGAKTGSLFVAATKAGALAAGADPLAWEEFGSRLGEAYQIADDIRDACSTSAELGKPVGRDVALGRPSAIRNFGLEDAFKHLDGLVDSALSAVPACPGAAELKSIVRRQVRWFVPKESALHAA
ncbi:MAG TPA: polyprenyl synthetase family protein [Hyphomicrobiaceae bacterium]|nr:polyprenyl synthetase family protein [Hyphomicrobiaceae bacterium]